MKRHVTKQEVMDLFGVNFGDEVVVTRDYDGKRIHYIVNEDGGLDAGKHITFELTILVGCDYEVVKPAKKLGDMRCISEILCGDCPLKPISCGSICTTPYEVLNNLNDRYGLPQGIYNAYKAELDKEVSEDERVSKDS